MVPPRRPAGLEARLGYSFHDPNLLAEALTHASAGAQHNQRLEFLGDALVNFCIAFLLHRERPDLQEGPMSKLRGVLVCTDSLAAWAESLALPLRMGTKGRSPSPGAKPKADAMEALLAAIHLDALAAGKDGIAPVLALVESRFLVAIREAHAGLWQQKDAKTTLQERAAALALPQPAYAMVQQEGPDHAPKFTAEVKVGELAERATGTTLKKAEAEAARKLLARLVTTTPAL